MQYTCSHQKQVHVHISYYVHVHTGLYITYSPVVVVTHLDFLVVPIHGTTRKSKACVVTLTAKIEYSWKHLLDLKTSTSTSKDKVVESTSNSSHICIYKYMTFKKIASQNSLPMHILLPPREPEDEANKKNDMTHPWYKITKKTKFHVHLCTITHQCHLQCLQVNYYTMNIHTLEVPSYFLHVNSINVR